MSVKVTVDLLKTADAKPVGCRICGGELVPALSMAEKGDVGHEFACVGHSHAAGRFLASDGEGLFTSSGGLKYVRLADAHGRAFFTEEVYQGKPRAVMGCGSTLLAHSVNEFVAYGQKFRLYCGTMHCGRLFAIDDDNRYVLRWSVSGVRDWDEDIKGGGNLILDPERGEGLDMVSFGGRLVVVRKYGLTFLKMYGSPENFSVALTDTDCEEIYENTAGTVFGKLYFYTASGLRCYDGSVIRSVNHRLADEISSPVCGAAYGGKYFLSCLRKDGSGAVLVYDPEDGESYFVDGRADCLCAADGVYAYAGTTAYKLGEGGEYTFTAGGIDFGTDGDKTLLNIRLAGGCADVSVSNGRETRIFQSARGIIRPRLKGRYFTVEVKGSNAVRLLEATAEVANEI